MAKKKKKQNNNNTKIDYETSFRDAYAATKSLEKRIKRTIAPGMQYDWAARSNFNSVVYPTNKIPDRMLRELETRNNIVGAVITLRIQQAMEYSDISHDKDVPGWEFVLSDPAQKMTPALEKEKQFLETFLKKSRAPNYPGFIQREGGIKELLVKFVRDRILIDKITWSIERNRKHEAVAIWPLDGATVLPVLPGGYFGPTSTVGISAWGGYSKLAKEIEKARLENIPPVEDITYVQELFYGSAGGGIADVFTNEDIIYDISNPLNDIRYYKQGLSVTEKAGIAIVAFMNSLTYNSNGLSRGAIPKVAVSMGKDSNYTQEQLEDSQDEWIANFSAMDGQWNIPFLNGDAKVLNLLPNNRDMEYQKFMEFVAALTCAVLGTDSAELGLRLNQAQNVLNENQDAKQLFSKNRGIRDMLGGFRHIVDRFIEISGFPFADRWVFSVNGLSTEDKGFEADLKKKATETYMTINEVRKAEGLEDDPYGGIITNPQYIQYRMQQEQAESMEGEEMEGEGGEEEEEGFGGFSDEDIDSTVDEAMEMQKAVRLI
jgi:hypothetical protein